MSQIITKGLLSAKLITKGFFGKLISRLKIDIVQTTGIITRSITTTGEITRVIETTGDLE